jgi:hypothetical protein
MGHYFPLTREPDGVSVCFVQDRAERGISIPERGGMTVTKDKIMNSIIYIVGLVVIVLVILSFLGLR